MAFSKRHGILFANFLQNLKKHTVAPRPDNSAKDSSADLKFKQFSQKYADNLVKDNSTNNSDRRSRANVLRACQQRVGLYTKLRAGYRRDAATRRRARSAPTGDLKPRNHPTSDFFLRTSVL